MKVLTEAEMLAVKLTVDPDQWEDLRCQLDEAVWAKNTKCEKLVMVGMTFVDYPPEEFALTNNGQHIGIIRGIPTGMGSVISVSYMLPTKENQDKFFPWLLLLGGGNDTVFCVPMTSEEEILQFLSQDQPFRPHDV